MFMQNEENIIQISFNSQQNINTHIKKQYFEDNFIAVISLFNIENCF